MRHVLVLSLLISLLGCEQRPAPGGAAPGGGAAERSAASANRYLAYEHTVAIETDDDQVAVLSAAAQSACREAVTESCAILQSSASRGDSAFAALKFRAKPAGIRKLIALLSAQGKIATESTTAEDLAGPIEDTAKKLAMLTSYRGQLEALRARSNLEVDAIIKLNRELAEVQSQIETLAGSQAHLTERVETEILNVSITSIRSHSFWSPIGASFSEFGENFSIGIASVIMALAYLIPWGALLFVLVWGLRKLWLRRKRVS